MKNTRLASNLKFIVFDFYYGIPMIAHLLALKNISELVADATGVANCFVYVSMGMTVNPIIGTAARDEVAKLRGECPVDWTSFKLVRHKFKRWHMVSCHDYMLGLTLCHFPLNELATTLMLLIETLCRQLELSVAYAVEVSHSSLGKNSSHG